MAMWPPAAQLLTWHFLQGLTENELQGPEVDERETIAAFGGALLTAGLFVSVLMGVKYIQTPFLTPGRTAIAVLDDTFLFAGWSFVIMALVAVTKWDVMTLTESDGSILGPLPVRRSVIVRAKLAALALFASGFALALSAAPSLIHPFLVAAGLRTSILDWFQLVAAHFVSSMAAGGFGFASVLALRETARGLLGAALFRRVSPVMQASLLAALVVALLLLPARSAGVARTWLAPDNRAAGLAPPVWFVGLHEAVAGQSIVGQTVGKVPAWPTKIEREAMPLYRSRLGTLGGQARRAVISLVLAVGLALAAYAWNTRRLALSAQGTARRGLWEIAGAVARRTVARRPEIAAGFFFSIQTLSRSVTHRTAMAVAVAVAAAAILVNTQRTSTTVPVPAIPLRFLAAHLAVMTAIVMGFRHAMRLPADPRATWTIQLAWSGQDRRYVAGVKRAGLLVLIVPAVMLLLPLDATVMGWQPARWHLLFGGLTATALLDASMVGARRLPFVASYLPSAALKWAVPVGFLTFLWIAALFAWIERAALASEYGSRILAAVLASIVLVLRVIDAVQRRRPATIDLAEQPPPPTQRLTLGE